MNGSEYAHERIDRLEKRVDELTTRVERQATTIELMSEFIEMQLGINAAYQDRLVALEVDRDAHRRMIDNTDARVGALEGL